MRQLRALLFDPTYGQAIVAKTVSQSFFFWLKYFFFILILYFLLLVGMVVYYVPQLSQLAKKTLPISLSLTHGQLILDPPTPLEFKFSDASVTFGTTGITTKYPDGQTDSQSYPTNQNYSLTRVQAVEWLASNQSSLLLIGILGALLLVFSLGLVYAAFQLLLIFILVLVATLVSRLRCSNLNFSVNCKLVFHALVPPLLLSLLAPGLVSTLITFVLFGYYYFTWIKNLPLQPFSR